MLNESILSLFVSTSEIKGSECMEKFTVMNDCLRRYPNLYEEAKDDNEDEHETDSQVATMGTDSKSKPESETTDSKEDSN